MRVVLLIVLGRDDTTTRPEMSQALFEQAAVPVDWKELLVVKAAQHMNVSRGAAYRGRVLAIGGSRTVHNR